MSDSEGSLGGGRIYYQVWVAPEARADVVISHGYAEHSGRYEHVAERLVTSGLSVWALDHRGHGRSAGERGDVESWDATVADLDLLVDVVAESGRPIFLLGHSMGGAIAVAYAEKHQERLAGLILSAPAIVIAPELVALADLDEIPELPLADVVSTDPAVVQAYKDDPLVYLGPPPRNLLVAMGAMAPVLERMSELTLPILVMQGSSDLLIPPQALREVVGRVASTDLSARLWPGLFHEIFNEPIKDSVLDVLCGWFTGRLG